MRSLVLTLTVLVSCCSSLPTNNVRDVLDKNKQIKEAIVAEIVQETLQKKKKIIKEDFEVKGFGCDVCLKAIYGINYNLAHLKTSAEDMVKKDCEALFDGDSEAIGACITLMIEKIEEYYEKVEPMIDTKHVCVKIGMCVRDTDKQVTTTVPNESSSSSSSVPETTEKILPTGSTTINPVVAKVEKVIIDLL